MRLALMVIGMAVATWLVRALPFALADRLRLPPSVQMWLHFMPIAILAALVGPELFGAGGTSTSLPHLTAALGAAAVAAWTRSLMGSVAIGVCLIALLRAVG